MVPAISTTGATSCGSAACHDGNGQPGQRGSEFTTWILSDPHARALAVLDTPRSRRMVDLLHGADAKAPRETRLCLACHASPGTTPETPVAASVGTGCASCHGDAGRWVHEHYRTDWKNKAPAEKQSLGMTAMTDLVVRARVCVRCHVGDESAEVNHDLIAAGHPALRFELGAYFANLPAHWDTTADRAGHPRFETELWALGQRESAAAALRLLAHRAGSKQAPWPEFAEYHCFDCHHDLGGNKARAARPRPGMGTWGSWYFSGVPLAASAGKDPALVPLAELRDAMERLLPDRGRVRDRAETLRVAVEKLAPDTEPDRLLARAVKRADAPPANWDAAAQTFLAVAAAARARPKLVDSRSEAPFGRLALELAFPRDPATGASYDSPRVFDPRGVFDLLKTLSTRGNSDQ
jgi:hypothetical protein